LGRILFGQSRKEVREKLADPLLQHGIALTMRSIATYGFGHPQIFIAPPVAGVGPEPMLILVIIKRLIPAA